MKKAIQYSTLVSLILCSSCATVLPKSRPERQAIVDALESHIQEKLPGRQVRITEVKASSSRAIVHYSVRNPPFAQQPYGFGKAKLVKHDGAWLVQWMKADVSLLTRIVLPHGK